MSRYMLNFFSASKHDLWEDHGASVERLKMAVACDAAVGFDFSNDIFHFEFINIKQK